MVMEGCREPSHLPSPRCVSAAFETARNSGPDRARGKFAAGWAKPEKTIEKTPEQGGNKDLAKRSEAMRGRAEQSLNVLGEMVTNSPLPTHPANDGAGTIPENSQDNVLAGPRLIVCDA